MQYVDAVTNSRHNYASVHIYTEFYYIFLELNNKSLIGRFSVSVVSWIIFTRLLAFRRSILRTGAITKWRKTKDWTIPTPKKWTNNIIYVDWRSHFFSYPLLRSIVRLFQVISKWMAFSEGTIKKGLNLPVSRFNFLLFL